MEFTEMQNMVPMALAITAICGAWLSVRRVVKSSEKAKKEQAEEIIKKAKEEDSTLKAKLEAKIKAIEAELANLKLNVEKDLEYMHSNYSSEIKTLGEKIEILRDELRSQNQGILTLLSKLVDKQ